MGEIAVWIGVAAAHREAAFDACRFVIDEVKRRVPIWKRENYADGSSLWISHPAVRGCAAGADLTAGCSIPADGTGPAAA